MNNKKTLENPDNDYIWSYEDGFNPRSVAKAIPGAVVHTADHFLSLPLNMASYASGYPYKDKRIPLTHNKDIVVPKTYHQFSLLKSNRGPTNPDGMATEPYTDHREGYWDEPFWDRLAADKKAEAETAKIRAVKSWPWETGQDLEGNPMPMYKPKPKINTAMWNRKPRINTERWNRPPEEEEEISPGIASTPMKGYGKDPKLGLSNFHRVDRPRSLDDL